MPEPGFIETVDQSEYALAADTDSSYSKIPLPFSKYEDIHRTVDYVQNLAHEFNSEYLKTFNATVVKHGNVDPKYNEMNFKSETVSYRGLFIAKKYYALVKMWDEGSFYTNPEIKKTGGQIVKADSTKIVFDLLTDIYETLLLDFSITDEIQLYSRVFFDLKDKYIKRTEDSVVNLNYQDFGIPKKWGLNAHKIIPKQVQGARFYNYLFQDVIRPGDGIMQCQIIINPERLLQYMDSNPVKGKYQITPEMVPKLNVISFPYDITEVQLKKIFELFELLGISFDLRTILDFNISKKFDQFQKVFSEEAKRLAQR